MTLFVQVVFYQAQITQFYWSSQDETKLRIYDTTFYNVTVFIFKVRSLLRAQERPDGRRPGMGQLKLFLFLPAWGAGQTP